MSSDENSNDNFTEKIKILATDDEKIKSFGELFTNDSSREILQLLFNEELTANQISQKTEISLQLVKYHLNKLQDLGVVKISKIEKNSKSQDMKVYAATKFSIVIVPPNLSEKTKESKLLVRSFRHIYKVAGLGIATGISGLLSLSQLQGKKVSVDDGIANRQFVMEESRKSLESVAEDTAQETMSSMPITESNLDQDMMNITETITDSDSILFGFDLFLLLLVITVILGGMTLFYLLKFKSK
ncbi:MAG: ArsR/SmtB family transcription factor [Nitrosopumilus sp.]